VSAARTDARNTVASRFAAITKGSFGSKPGADGARPKAPARPEPPPAAPSRPSGAKPSGSGSGKAVGSGSAASRQGGKPPQAKPQEGDALESSILAAIAQAVDVLVEDGGDKPKAKQSAPPAAEIDVVEAVEVEVEIVDIDVEAEEGAEPPPDPEPSQGGDSEDIGDEIQRIIASYSRARNQTD
jgi:hypothetical protein